MIYDIDIDKNNDVNITMTLTTPNCPEAQSIPEKGANTVLLVNGVKDVKVQITGSLLESRKDDRCSKLELGLI